MAIEHHSFGAATSGRGGVKVRFQSSDGSTTSVDLGYTRDGIDIEVENMFHVIKSDDYGGEDGPPADEQILGQTATLTTELVKYERDELDKLETWDYDGTAAAFGGTAGTQAAATGTFVRQDGVYGILDLVGPVRTLRFHTAFPRKKTMTKGTKNSVYTIQWQAWPDANQKLFTELATA